MLLCSVAARSLSNLAITTPCLERVHSGVAFKGQNLLCRHCKCKWLSTSALLSSQFLELTMIGYWIYSLKSMMANVLQGQATLEKT